MEKSIRKKFILYIVPIVFLVSALSFYFVIANSRKIVEQETYLMIKSKQDEQSNTIENVISNIKGSADVFATGIGSSYQSTNASVYNKIISNMLTENSQLRSAGVWLEPYVVNKNQKYVRYFVEKQDDSLIVNDDYNSEDYEYINNPLYIQCKELNQSFFSEAHFHELAQTYVITYVTPIQNDKGEFIGCITSSFEIEQLKNLIDKYSDEILNFYILDNKGIFIGHTDLELVKSRTNILDYRNNYTDIAKTIFSSESGVLTQNVNGEKYYVYYDTVSEFDWKLVYEIPASYINKPIRKITIINILVCIVVISLLISLIGYISNTFIYKPLQLLLSEFKNISENNYDSDIPNILMKSDTEFSDLGKSLKEMKENLADYQRRLKYKHDLLIENEKSIKESSDYINAIINALPITMFVFDRNVNCIDVHGITPFETRTKEFFIGKHYNDVIGRNTDEEVVNIIKTINYDDGVIQAEISYEVDGTQEYFEHNLIAGPNDTVISLCRRITDTVNYIQDMTYLNEFDELTGLYNSRYYIDMVKKHVENSSLPISVIVCDLNGLKSINDKYGFDFGDSLLVDLTNVLNNITIENKTVARIAGDEFAVILPKTTKQEAEKIVEDINLMCLSKKVSKIPFSISYGVDTALTNNESLFNLIKSVEELLFKHKVYTSGGQKNNSIGLINSIFHAKNKREQLHSNRVSEICLEMAKALGWSQLEQCKMSTAGLLHDIGKIGISESLLNKPSKLTDEEYAEICTHPEIGYRILQSFDNMKDLAQYAYAHHEKWDGTGYPRKLKGAEIPIESRILAIADTFDAMTSSRSYRDGLPKEVAIKELIRCKNTQFDPELVDIFVEKVMHEKLED